MDKKIIQAVAGSGKTTFIIDNLNLQNKSLIITYTDNNTTILKNAIVNKFGYIPDNISIFTYFTFLYNFCIRPQENIFNQFSHINRSKGIDFNSRSTDVPRWIKSDNINYYINRNKQFYSFRISKLLVDIKGMFDFLKNKLEKYFENIYIDEVQDFSAHDFDFLLKLHEVDINIYLLGDFYQHTYDTSTDGNKNSNLYKDYQKYKDRFLNKYDFDEQKLIKSHRCSKNVCEFVSNKLKINMQSHRNDNIEIRELLSDDEINEVLQNNNIVKLFYQSHKKYNLTNSDNWGNSKGMTFDNVCVVLNKATYINYKNDKLDELKETTLRKFYVGVTRARNTLYFVEESKVKILLDI